MSDTRTIDAYLGATIICPDCGWAMGHQMDDVDVAYLECQNIECPNLDKRFQAIKVKLKELPENK